MEHKFTLNDLTRFLYHETTASETIAICEALQCDDALFLAYENLEAGKQILPKVTFSPSKRALNEVLNFSKRTAVAEC